MRSHRYVEAASNSLSHLFTNLLQPPSLSQSRKKKAEKRRRDEEEEEGEEEDKEEGGEQRDEQEELLNPTKARVKNMDKATCSAASSGQFKSAIVDLYGGEMDKELSTYLDMYVRSYAKVVAKKKRAGVMAYNVSNNEKTKRARRA